MPGATVRWKVAIVDDHERCAHDHDFSVLIGASANFGSGGGAPLIGNAGFGSESYGRIIMPGGVWYNEFTLKIP